MYKIKIKRERMREKARWEMCQPLAFYYLHDYDCFSKYGDLKIMIKDHHSNHVDTR
jgi:hypothetical protein